ncbi:glycosyl transferase family 90 [Methylorubrum aminovorans]
MFSDLIPSQYIVEAQNENVSSTFDLQDGAINFEYWKVLKESFPSLCSSSLKRVLFNVEEVASAPHDGSFTSNPGINFSISINDTINVTVDPRILRLSWATKRCGAVLACVQAICSDLEIKECRFSVCDTGDPKCLSFSLPATTGEMLIPDVDYITSFGYRTFLDGLGPRLTPWEARKDRAFWRGSLILNVKQIPNGRSLEALIDASQRIKLCALSKKEHRVDAKCTSIWVPDRSVLPDLLIKHYMGPATSNLESMNYKYLFDIDGFSNSWSGLFQKLLTGSPVLKVDSPNKFRQWYYEHLDPWVNFVPIGIGMSDVGEVLDVLFDDECVAKKIGEKGRELAETLSYDSQMQILRSKIVGFSDRSRD